MEPTFSFLRDFELSASAADLACRIGSDNAALAWGLADAGTVPSERAAPRYDSTATLQAGQGIAAEIAAAVVAANIALIANAVLVTPAGDRIEADDALEWASELVRALRKGARRPRVKKAPTLPPPRQLVSAWLSGLVGAEVTLLVHSLPDDPLLKIHFGTGMSLMLRRWRVSTCEGATHSTAGLPRALSPAECQQVLRARDRLGALLQSGPVRHGRFDESALSIRLGLPDGELEVLPASTLHPGDEDWAFRDGDRWELSKDGLLVYPDVDAKALKVDRR